MASGLSITSSAIAHRFKQNTYHYQVPKPFSKSTIATQFRRKSFSFRLCLVKEKNTENNVIQVEKENTVEYTDNNIKNQVTTTHVVSERLARKTLERYTYLVAAIMSSFGVTSMAAMSVYYRFSWQMEVLFFFFFLMF